jgi:rifampicin phosphotransferase
MSDYVRSFPQIDRTQVAAVGGKGAHLGELVRIDGIRVPPGFCITTDAYRRILAGAPSVDALLDRLSEVEPDDGDAIGARSAAIRRAVESAIVPDDVVAAITGAWTALGEDGAYAVRSSATAEDLPTTSFAGQHDTHLNVTGISEILGHVRRCWASLHTERAVAYRLRHGVDHRGVHMAVVVQRMVVPSASGILFTADPVTSNRRVTSVESTFGLGESLVSGLVNPDVFTVRDGAIVDRTIATKDLSVTALPSGGTHQEAIAPAVRDRPSLTDAEVVQLEQLGRRIEAHFAGPQDIEWCLSDATFHVVQSRPITTLFPVPHADDGERHVYLSVGHQQMMTDPMKPLGLAVWQMTAAAPMHIAGGRLFVDVAARLTSPSGRAGVLEVMGRSDPLMRDALEAVLERGDFIPLADEDPAGAPPPVLRPAEPIETDPAIVTDLIARNRASVEVLRAAIAGRSGEALFEFIRGDIPELQRILFDPRSYQVFMTAMEATWWLNEHLEEWLGETNAADAITQSVPNNVTSEMGLALLDVADVIRPYPAVVEYLGQVGGGDFLDELGGIEGGPEASGAIRAFLDRYGMRCVGEIDITRPRWIEHPATLLPVILGNVRNFGQGAAARVFDEGRRQAEEREQDLLARVGALPDGGRLAGEVKARIDQVRTFIGYREYPKFGMVSRYAIYKQALLEEADRLVGAGVLGTREDAFFLTFDELAEVARTGTVDAVRIRERKEAFRSYGSLVPPRVLTSDGEAVLGSYRRDGLPPGALVGLAVSAGTVEGRARVVLDIGDAVLDPGDILVTAFTDPSWTPLFVSAAGLVTEVGGQMTHGAVIAREYGLPAVVGVEDATGRIRDGQYIRVHGTRGFVEVLS